MKITYEKISHYNPRVQRWEINDTEKVYDFYGIFQACFHYRGIRIMKDNNLEQIEVIKKPELRKIIDALEELYLKAGNFRTNMEK